MVANVVFVYVNQYVCAHAIHVVDHAALWSGRTCMFAGVNAGCCAVSHASTRWTSVSDSFTLYTSTDWIAKSAKSSVIYPVLIASLAVLVQPLLRS